jgi:putative transcriptional regulator
VANKKTNYKSERLAVLHKTAAALHRAGALEKTTMREIEAFCITKVPDMQGKDIQALRAREGVSQAVLAQHINVSVKLVSDWERDVKHPSGPSLKLLALAKSKGLEAIA